MNESGVDAALLAYCKATGLNPSHSDVLREAIRQAIAAYLDIRQNKSLDTSCLMCLDVPYCEECTKKREAMADYTDKTPDDQR